MKTRSKTFQICTPIPVSDWNRFATRDVLSKLSISEFVSGRYRSKIIDCDHDRLMLIAETLGKFFDYDYFGLAELK